MKKLFLFVAVTLFSMVTYADFFVEVNGNTYYAADETGEVDFQGRTQYMAPCVSLKAGDVLTCYNGEAKVSWVITKNDVGATWGAKGFTATASGLKCSVAGNYDVYVKLAYEDDIWYIEGPKTGCTPATPADPDKPAPGPTPGPTPGYDGSAPAQYPGVMLQGFYWNSNMNQSDTSSLFGRTRWIDLKPLAQEIGRYFDLVWLPPCTSSSGGLGYHPTQYSNLDSGLGTKKNLLAVIDTLHNNGCRVVADIVVNHCDGVTWCTFNKLDFGTYGKFQPTAAWICNTDEMNIDGSGVESDCLGKATGGRDDGYGSEANYASSRDWDHNNAEVRDMIKAYLKWLRYTVGFDGFRYDYCKGFHMSHVNDYNTTARARFSVLEYWDGNVNTLQDRLNDAGWNTLTFDFANYYTAMKNGIAAGNYGMCKGAGLPGAGKSRYACTYVDSHDTFDRGKDGQSDVCGNNDPRKLLNDNNYRQKVLACNAFLLSMPGVPCVFYPHWVALKDDIKKMINARYLTGVHSESSVSDETGNGFYKATITGTNGSIRLLLGPNSGYGTTPSGYTLAAKGTNWGVYYKTNSARGDKDKSRTPIVKDQDPEFVTAIPSVESEASAPKAEKLLIDGRLYLRTTDGMIFDLTGRRQ